jgi:hypothetical protein
VTRQEFLARLERASKNLEVVDLPMVFVGGATMPLYLDGETHELRETKDVDVMVEATSYGEFAELEERLRAAGFEHDTSPQAPRCRWLKDGEQYDIVDVRTDYPSDPWTRATGPGIEHRALPSGRTIPVLSPGRFLAAKVAALIQRGGPHWYVSSDFEDIVLLLESHPQLQPWLATTPPGAVVAVAAWAKAALIRPGIAEEIEATVSRGPGMEQRVEAVFDRLHWLAFAWPSLCFEAARGTPENPDRT